MLTVSKLQGFQTFQLEFSLPYLVLRAVPTSEKHGRGARNKQQCWTDLSFLNISSSADTNSHHTIHESQVSIVLFGIDHNQWTGYAFARRCCTDTNENAEHEDGSYSDELSKEDGHLLEDELENNPFSLHDGVPSERHDFVWDPRAYWLCIVARRLRIVHQEWEYLVHRVDHAAKALHKSPVSAANANPTTSELNRSLKLMLLVQTLQERILTVIRAWEEFSSPSGDIAYFEDLDECYIHATLNSIHETFENLKQLERKLDSMGKYCERKLLQIRMEVESSRPNYETNEIARRIHSLCLLTNALAFESQKLHRRGTQAAETTSKISRWNVSLIWIITPIIITLLYFGSDRNIFSFDRNTKTFFISMGVLMVALPLITWLLNIVLTKSRAIIFKTVWVRSSSAVRRQAASEKLFLA
ncbi:uncharacterized protein K460DRAFT_50845 [Cucurbitaria berberidis CBS 394.84]|uniref:Uncharacterized protein n=1 Tax=Cucurbitaria berberidis CBS 394.84 TaxID=1168544 RepID=A0A9P4GKL1_9PLEO|nr:uncharacterized protein K460DRAFT_50845 [Cucurbitaria berberidis CBS 394.84]KAF1846957.1 hypothetical protein K460DRAFT_50845 [Cucurbitaria berberidis CBS 394.84]